MSTVRRALVDQRRRVAAAAALFVGHQVGEVLVPVVAGLAIDRAVLTHDAAALGRWLVVLGLVFAVLSTSWRWADRVLTRAMEDAAHSLRMALIGRALDDRGMRPAAAAGELLGIAGDDAATAARALGARAFGLAAVGALATAAAILVLVAPLLGALVLVGLPLAVLALGRMTRPLERRAAEQRARATTASALATDLLTGLSALKGLRAEAAASDRYRRASRRSLRAGLRASRAAAVHEGATVLVTGSFVAVVAVLAGRMAAAGDLGLGGLVAAVGVTQFLVGPLWRLGYAAGEGARARASARRITEVLDRAPAVHDQAGPRAPQAGGDPDRGGRDDGAVRLAHVRHRSLDGFDLDVAPGALVAVAAADPADATALVELLARRADPTAGTIELDGVHLADLPLAELRRRILVAGHDATLFSGSVLANVVGVVPEPGSAPDADRARGDVLGVLAAAGAADLPSALAAGIDTPVGPGGRALSGGQRQRVALARALLADPPVLVLHDPTTAVDPVTEQRAAEGIRTRRAARTTVAVATTPALLAVADEVVWVEGGRAAARGRHRDLLARYPSYAELVLA